MKSTNDSYKNIIRTLVISMVVLSCTTGWYSIDYIGMSKFWIIFTAISLLIVILIIKYLNMKNLLVNILRNKINIIAVVYLIWISLTYFINYTGTSTILYIFKMWFILVIYLIITQVYFGFLNKDEKGVFVYKLCKSIFFLGNILSLIAIYQFVFSKNTIFGIVITDWPTYNPASLYGNVNGFGTYLFLSIVSGLYCLSIYLSNTARLYIVSGLVIQLYMLYLTVARTSIVVTLLYLIIAIAVHCSYSKREFKSIFNKKVILAFIIVNLCMIGIVNKSEIKFIFTKTKSAERTAIDMIEEKNSKGVNNRQFIWKAVINDYDKYIAFGDGLKYNVIKKINIEEVISKRSKGDTRISYHNTLFRYFASNGVFGVFIFLVLFLYSPLRLLVNMIKRKQFSISYFMFIVFFICIFLYMQMEEVYIGEIGLVAMITTLCMSFSSSLLNEKKY